MIVFVVNLQWLDSINSRASRSAVTQKSQRSTRPNDLEVLHVHVSFNTLPSVVADPLANAILVCSHRFSDVGHRFDPRARDRTDET